VAAQDAIDYIDFEIDGTNLGGFTVQARVEVRTTNAATSVTPKIRNITDGTDAGVGAACSAINTDYSGVNCRQTIPITLVPGLKKYRLQLTPSTVNDEVFGIGYVEIFASA